MPAIGSSSTSSPTSTSSCTSDDARRRGSGPGAGARGSRAGVLVGVAKLTHPFPSAVDAAVVGAIAALDRAPVPVALSLAGSMFLLQATIGIGNDVVDVDRDRGRRDKPLAAGSIGVSTARRLAAVTALAGLGLAATSGPVTVGVAGLGLAIGLAYDLWLRGTRLSWLPFAFGIPLLPVFAWVGGSGCVPPAALLLVPLAIIAGTQLALANALADLENDVAAGIGSVATALGAQRAWRASAALAGVVGGSAGIALVLLGGAGAGAAIAAVACVVLATAVAISHGSTAARRQLGWALDCIGLALLAAGWVAALIGSRALPVPPC